VQEKKVKSSPKKHNQKLGGRKRRRSPKTKKKAQEELIWERESLGEKIMKGTTPRSGQRAQRGVGGSPAPNQRGERENNLSWSRR